MIQLTIIKITGYGPWTLTLGSDREHKLQMLQSSIYNEIQNLFSEKNGLVFSNRFDELFAITNGLSLNDHIKIQKKLAKSFDLQLSMTIGYGDSPFEANLKAYEARKSKIILEKKHNIFGYVDGKAEQLVQIMHMDVDDSTSISANLFLNKFLSSVSLIAFIEVPSTLTLCFLKILLSCSSTPQFSAVCPPNASIIPSGFSFSMTFSTK